MKVGIVGLGYFSAFHIEAWRKQDVDVIGSVDPDPERRAWAHETYGLPVFEDVASIVDQAPDIVDIIAPPAAHLELIEACAAKGRVLICQKPFCTSFEEARLACEIAKKTGVRVVVHENFRFQPWHRTIKSFLEGGRMGQVYQAQFNLRPGDGRGEDAYLARQPVFQTMPRLLMHETGVHFVDLFRWLFGEIKDVYADVSRLNPVIAGEDAGVLMMNHESGVRSVFDGNRLSDHQTDDPRRTMGEMWIEGEGGVLLLNGAGEVSFRAFGAAMFEHVPLVAEVDENSFGGGCVFALIDHVVRFLRGEGQLENEADQYLGVTRAIEAVYGSAQTGQRIKVS